MQKHRGAISHFMKDKDQPTQGTAKERAHRPFELKHFGNFYFVPYKAKPGSIGFDLVAPVDFIVPAHTRCHMPLNIAINLPRNIEGKIEPRSGFSIRGMEGYGKKKVPTKLLGFIPWRKTVSGKLDFDADVLVGKIDPGYTDNINVIIKNNDQQFLISRGTRIAQITFYRTISPEFEIVEQLSCASRGGGLGSSGTTSEEVIFPLGANHHCEYEEYCKEKRDALTRGVMMPPFEVWCSMKGLSSIGILKEKTMPFHEYYASLSPEKRAEIDSSLMGQTFNSSAPTPE